MIVEPGSPASAGVTAGTGVRDLPEVSGGRAVVGWVFRQSVLQRRLGLMTVGATTAAGHGEYAAPDADQRDAIRLAATATAGLFRCVDGRAAPVGEPLPIDSRAADQRTLLGSDNVARVSRGRSIRP